MNPTTIANHTGTMQAATVRAYGGPELISINDIPRPLPGDDEVLVQVHAAALHAGDALILKGEPAILRLMTGLTRPKQPVPGADLSGVVAAIGKNITRFQVGDAVFGGRDGFHDYGGALAQYCRVPEHKLEHKPENLGFDEAAAVAISGSTALAGLIKAKLKAGQSVLINGATGGVGSFAVQIAKALGAEVTAVCSTGKSDFVRELGADHVIDYKHQDYTRLDRKWDLVFDAACFRPVSEAMRAAKANGKYLLVGGSTGAPFAAMGLGLYAKLRGGPQILSMASESTPELLARLAEMLRDQKIRPAIDRVYELAQSREAFAYLSAGHTRGKVVIRIES
ncbi:MAG: NAD(P)-dependent alcohol dehydrogenase [bacterium]|nr:NAD(P)-dependent alcohol dehydrogenase [bacterium]